MPLLQLEERIAQELESNVTLEIVEGADGPTSDADQDAADAASDAEPRRRPHDRIHEESSETAADL